MRSTSRLCVSGVCICLLTIAFSGCGQSESGVTDSVSNQDEHRSFLPTVAIPGPKPSANKGNGNASKPVIGKPNTGKSAAEKPTNGKSGSTTKTNDAGASKKSQATSKDGEVDDAAVAKEPEKGSPDWLLVEIQKIRITPLPGSDEDEDDESEEDDDESDQEKDDKDPTPEEDARLAKLFEDQKKVRRERNLQIVKLAEECIAKTNKKPEFEAQFDSAAHQLLDARLQLALQGDSASVDALYDAARAFHDRKAGSDTALEAQMTLVNLTHANALRYGRTEPKWIKEFAKHAQLLATRFPEQQGDATRLLEAAARTCEFNGLRDEAKSCYSVMSTKFKGTPQAQHAEGAVRRFGLKGKTLELAGPTMDGNEFNIESLKGKMVVVVFWATHAKPFVDQLPKIVATAKKYEKYATFVGVNLDTEEPTVEAFLEKTGLTWPQIFAPNREQRGWNSPLVVHYGINSLPTIWIVDPNGAVVETYVDAESLASKLHETYLPYLKATSVKPAGATK